jgi:predicted secreted protein
MNLNNIKKSFLPGILIVLLILTLSGCSKAASTSITTTGVSSISTSISVNIIQSTPVTVQKNIATVYVDKSYNGLQIHISSGSSLQVQLESNPSTGYSWKVVNISDSNVLAQISNTFETPMYKLPEGQVPPVGAGGLEYWNFKALNKGTSTISMDYNRSWDASTKGTQTFSLTVVVE